MKSQLLLLCAMALTTTCCASQPIATKQIPADKLGEVIYCLHTKLASTSMAPPKAQTKAYVVQYFFGVLTPKEEAENELQLIVYAPGEASANYYRVYFDDSQKNSIDIGDGGTLRQENGKMVPDEISGGLGTLEEMKKVLEVTNKQSRIVIPESQVVQGKDACIFDE